MNDRFKFRFWNGRTLIYDDLPHLELYNCDDYKWMQCTGLKDKNGKLIYEGDIIAFMNPYENDKLMAIIVIWESTPIVTGFNFGEEYAKNVEVIGNIYENPELLKECE